ncbi:23S rRNA (adenine(2503)-C(2))-methyltransferase RlmN [Spirochaetia bacterium 38H-sp]|uniref:Probable dual-specificity RNA methyltransferase RlmN n=1 Tax=Rarispira pelagica TaxID=3141764 RepID=A0ABU9UD41_9SPIR
MQKKQLCALLPDEIASLLDDAALYRGKQIFQWIHAHLVDNFDSMTNLPKDMRNRLIDSFCITNSKLGKIYAKEDSAEKAEILLEDSNIIETVLLEDGKGRKTACLSSQVGCAMGCSFCKTGSLGFARNLSAEEIVSQWLFLKKRYPELSHIVFMGMGEPLLNLENLKRAVEIITNPAGAGISKRHITVSTCGIVPGIMDIAEKGPDIRLAVSLITVIPEKRELIMPISKKYPPDDIKEALTFFQYKKNKRVTLEIVLIDGLTDTKEDMDMLVRFSRGLSVMVNLIPWNPIEGMDYKSPSEENIERFKDYLEKKGLAVTVRHRKGRSINGACGQLGKVIKRPYSQK